MSKLDYQQAKFLLSVADLSQLPPDKGVEVAIVGRSNAGKSSVLNQLTQNKKLARTSKTPGRTQFINLFSWDDNRRIAVFPGYGYAKASPAMKKRWQTLIDGYLRDRECLKGLILVSDIRHPLKEFDQNILAWSEQCGLAVHILLNKSDKLTQSAASASLRNVKNKLSLYSFSKLSIQTFSALKGKGMKELREQIDQWFF